MAFAWAGHGSPLFTPTDDVGYLWHNTACSSLAVWLAHCPFQDTNSAPASFLFSLWAHVLFSPHLSQFFPLCPSMPYFFPNILIFSCLLPEDHVVFFASSTCLHFRVWWYPCQDNRHLVASIVLCGVPWLSPAGFGICCWCQISTCHEILCWFASVVIWHPDNDLRFSWSVESVLGHSSSVCQHPVLRCSICWVRLF
jgi:hypothetical protein